MDFIYSLPFIELYFPSHFDTTTTARELPNTFTTVLAISSIRSIPAIKARPSAGIPTEPRVASKLQKILLARLLYLLK